MPPESIVNMTTTVRMHYTDMPISVTVKIYNEKIDFWDWLHDLKRAALPNALWGLLTTDVNRREVILAKPTASKMPEALCKESCWCHYGESKLLEAETTFLEYKSLMKVYMYDRGEWEAQQKTLKAARVLLLNTLGLKFIGHVAGQLSLLEAMKSLMEV